MLDFDQDEEERRRQLLGGLLGGGITPQEPAAAPAEMPAPMAQPTLQAPDTSFMQGPQGLGGYKPPPAASPEFMQHVGGREFGAGDIAMLGGILAALIGGGKNGGSIAGALAGSYGQGVIGDMQNRNQRNAEIDTYNNKLANQNTELDQWKADQEAQLQHGNLQARNRGLAGEEAREKRIAERLALQDDPESALNQGEVTQAGRLAKARSDVELTEAQKRSEIEYKKQELLAQLLGKGKFAAPAGKGVKATKPKTAKQELDDYTSTERLRLIKEGKLNLDGKPIDDKGNIIAPPKAGTSPEREPFADTEFENPELFNEKSSTAANYQKNSEADAGMVSGIGAFREMEDLLQQYGSQAGTDEESAALVGQFDAAKGKVQAAYGVLKNLGILQPGESAMIDRAIGADMGYGLADAGKLLGRGDTRIGKLSGARKAFENALTRMRHANGLRAKGAGAPAASNGSKAKAGDGFSEAPSSASSGGTRSVTITTTDGRTKTADLSPAEIEELKADKRIRSVQ